MLEILVGRVLKCTPCPQAASSLEGRGCTPSDDHSHHPKLRVRRDRTHIPYVTLGPGCFWLCDAQSRHVGSLRGPSPEPKGHQVLPAVRQSKAGPQPTPGFPDHLQVDKGLSRGSLESQGPSRGPGLHSSHQQLGGQCHVEVLVLDLFPAYL